MAVVTLPKKSLAETHPHLADEWHPRKNGALSPDDVTAGSSRSVWWKCRKGDDHEWEACVSSRGAGSGCSVCRGRTVVKSNCLLTVHPHLAAEWHPTENRTTPAEVYAYSTKEYW